MMKKIILATLLLIILMQVASASYIVRVHEHDLKLEAYDHSDYLFLCDNTPRVDQYILTNLGEFDVDITVKLETPVDWMKTSEKEFRLSAGDKKSIFLYFESPKNLVKNFDYKITIESNLGRKEIVEKNIQIGPCQNIKVYDTEVKPAHPCSVMHFPLIVENVGGFTEKYTLTFDKYSEYVDSSAYEFELEPGQQKELEVYAKLSCDIYGDVELPFSIHANTNEQTEQFSVILPIKRSYFYDLKVKEEASLCAIIPQELEVAVENHMGFENPVKLDFTGPGFAHLKDSELIMPGDGIISTKIEIQAEQNRAGTHELRVDSKAKYGEIEKTTLTQLTINNCYDYTVEALPHLEKVMCGEQTFTLKLKNHGTEQIRLKILHSGDQEIEYKKEHVLSPGEEKLVPIKVKLDCKDQEHEIKFFVEDMDHEEIPARDITIKFTEYSKETAYGLELRNKEVVWYYDTETIPVIIKNTGIKGGHYTINLEHELVGIKVDTIHLLPGEEKVLHLLPRVGLEEYETGRTIGTFDINLIDPEEVHFERDLEVILKKKHPLDLWLNKVIFNQNYRSLGWCGIATIALLILLIIGVILTERMNNRRTKISRRKIKDRETINVFIGLFVAAFIILLLIAITMPQPDKSNWYEGPLNDTDPLKHTWAENTNYQIDLDQYFIDPDGDELSYTSSQPSDIEVNIVDNVATLKPVHSFSGENKIIFTAIDGNGGITDSDFITLSVIKRKPISWVEHWTAYCNHTNIFILAFIFLIAGLYLAVYKERKDKEAEERKAKRGRK